MEAPVLMSLLFYKIIIIMASTSPFTFSYKKHLQILWNIQDTILKNTTLFIAIKNGSLDLYRMLQAYSMFDMKVMGLTLRDVSITYTMTVGNTEAYIKTEKWHTTLWKILQMTS